LGSVVRNEVPTTDAIALTVPTVSVVVPTFRRTERLSQLLARLASIERSGELEVIIVDQTPNANLQDLNRYSERFFSLLLIHQNEANVSRARNAGALAAGADVLFSYLWMTTWNLCPNSFLGYLTSLPKGATLRSVQIGVNRRSTVYFWLQAYWLCAGKSSFAPMVLMKCCSATSKMRSFLTGSRS
jgi:glycosyltransferase involved in cell wall biosynthesis